jgi:hypothetical protein
MVPAINTTTTSLRRSRMKTEVFATLLCVVLLGGCTSLRLTGTVMDDSTGDVVGTCGLQSGPKYAKVDSAGHFAVNVRKYWKTATLTCAGYETQEIKIDGFATRYPQLTIRVKPRRVGKATGGSTEAASAHRAPSADTTAAAK